VFFNKTIAFLILLCLNSITTKQNKQGCNNMEMSTAAVEQVTISDILELATWQRERSSDELKSFIARHEENISDFNESLA
jgi:hypothetical protein